MTINCNTQKVYTPLNILTVCQVAVCLSIYRLAIKLFILKIVLL